MVEIRTERVRRKAQSMSATCYGLALLFVQVVTHSDGPRSSGLAFANDWGCFGWPLKYCLRLRRIALPEFELYESIFEWRYGALAVDVLASMVMIVAVYFVSGWLVARPVKGLRFTMRDLLWCVTVVCIIAATMHAYQLYPRRRPPPGAVLVITLGITCTAVCLGSGLAGIGAWICRRIFYQEASNSSNADRDRPVHQ